MVAAGGLPPLLPSRPQLPHLPLDPLSSHASPPPPLGAVGRVTTRRAHRTAAGTLPSPVAGTAPPCRRSYPLGAQIPPSSSPLPRPCRRAARHSLDTMLAGHWHCPAPVPSPCCPYPQARNFRRQRRLRATPTTPLPSSPLCHRPPHPATSPQLSPAVTPSGRYKRTPPAALRHHTTTPPSELPPHTESAPRELQSAGDEHVSAARLPSNSPPPEPPRHQILTPPPIQSPSNL